VISRRGRASAVFAFVVWFTACSTSSTSPTVTETEGARLLEEGRYRESLEVFRRSIQDGRASYVSMMGMAIAYVNLGDVGLFEAFALEASRAAPGDIDAWHRLGLMYLRGAERLRDRPNGERYARLSVEYLRRVFAGDESRVDPYLLYHLGLGLVLSHDAAGATVLLEEALLRAPTRIDVLQVLLAAHRDLGHRERVGQLVQVGLNLDPRPELWESYRRWLEDVPTPMSRPSTPENSPNA
jgi:hypothetical protein